MTLDNQPGSFKDIDPEKDFFRAKFVESDTDDVTGILVPSERVKQDDVWYVRAAFAGVFVSESDYNDGHLAIMNGTVISPEPDEPEVLAQRMVEDGTNAQRPEVETYLRGEDCPDGIGIGISFPNANWDYYSQMAIFGEAVKLRDGFDLTENAFNPYSPVQTYDGTTDIESTFKQPSMDTSICDVYDQNGNGVDDTIDIAAEVPEYSDADNPTFTFEIRNTDNKNGTSSWPDTYTELTEKGTLPQPGNVSSWPITAAFYGNTELPEPNQLNNYEVIHYYEARAKIWEAGDKANTVTYSSDTWTFQMYAPPASIS